MSSVQTVRGPVDTADLGKVLMHEHVFVLGEELRQNYPDYPPEPWDEEVRVADAVAKLTEVKSRGISTIVDPTVIGLGRYIPRIVRINEQVDLNIIVATGIYTYNDIPFQFHYTGPGLLFDGPPEPMVELFVKDIREGIAGTGVRASFLKCAIEEPGLTPPASSGSCARSDSRRWKRECRSPCTPIRTLNPGWSRRRFWPKRVRI